VADFLALARRPAAAPLTDVGLSHPVSPSTNSRRFCFPPRVALAVAEQQRVEVDDAVN
jgi:hypothetical protein